MSLISNLEKNFNSFSNVDRSSKELVDLNSSLDNAIKKHIVSPELNFSFVQNGLGSTWSNSFSLSDQPTKEIKDVCSYIDINLEKPISLAVSRQIENCSILISTVPPSVAQACVPIINSALATYPDGQSISSTMNSSVTSANSTGNVQLVQQAVSLALSAISKQILANQSISRSDKIKRLDFDMQTVGLIGVTQKRREAWKQTSTDILSIERPMNIYPTEDGSKFWKSIIETIEQGTPV